MVGFAWLPPETNSLRMYLGAGSRPLLAAAGAWDGLAEELHAAASIGPRPAPANMRAEFTSGGKTAKFIAVYFLGWPLSVGHHRGGYPR